MRLRTRIRFDDFTIGLRHFFNGAVSQHGANLASKHCLKRLTSDYTFQYGFLFIKNISFTPFSFKI
jgi:hypothetical protein